MPIGLIPAEGAIVPGAAWLRDTSPILVPWKLVLWVNDLEPTKSTVWADVTEASWAGYARVTLTRSMWSPVLVDDECVGWSWGSVPYVWTNTGSGTPTNYGWTMFDDVLSRLLFIQRFDETEIGPLAAGGKFKLLPRITSTNSACPGESLTLTRLRKPYERKGKSGKTVSQPRRGT